MKRPSLKLRITGWFALMMFVIEALVLAFLLAVNGTVATNDPEARLVTRSIEGSNVAATTALVEMIEASRSWAEEFPPNVSCKSN